MTVSVLILTLVAANVAGIVAKETGFVSHWLTVVKFAILLAAVVYYARVRNHGMARYSVVLTAIVGLGYGAALVARAPWWQDLFNMGTVAGYYSSMVSVKFLSTIPLVALLLAVFKSPGRVYLVPGDLSVKAEPIKWLGIHPNWVSWGKLSVISAFAIAGGTLLLTLFTVTGFSVPEAVHELPRHIPIILFLALVNSLSEGFIFRNAILGSLRDVLPKGQVLLVAAVFFGLAHFYGAPSGVVGVVMSGLLGWYMSRSMYETGGLIAPWIIHFLQDTVIFTTFLLLVRFI